MPEVSTKPNKKLALKKKYGPLSGTGWLIAGGAVAGVFIVISKIKSSSATPASGVLGGTSNMVPSGNTVTSGVSSTQSFSTMGQWVDAAIANMNAHGLNATDAYNGVQNWLNGVCVSAAQYTALGSVITSQGLPPGYSTGMPSLVVCPTSTTPTSTTPTSTTPATTSSSSAPATTASSAGNIPASVVSSSPVQKVIDYATSAYNTHAPVSASVAATPTYVSDVNNLLSSGSTAAEAQAVATNAANFQLLSQAQKTYANLIASGSTPAQALAISGPIS